MSNTQVSLTVTKIGDSSENGAQNASTTTINTDSLSELSRMLELAGIKSDACTTVPAMEDAPGEEYAGPTSLKPISPDQKLTNNYGDNPLAEDEVDDRKLADAYHSHRKDTDHEESVARTADEYGVTGDRVEAATKHHKAYEGKSFKDYVREMEEAKLVERFGQDAHRRGIPTMALLPCPGLFNLETLGTNEYFGDTLRSGESGIVALSINLGNGKERLTYASTYGDPYEYKPGQNVMTYHDQTGAERPATVLLSFRGSDYATEEGRAKIANDLRKVGIDPNKKLSVRVFK